MTKRISLVVTYDTESEMAIVDLGATEILIPEGACWDDDRECWVEEPELVDDLARRLRSRLDSGQDLWKQAPAETNFIELALNIIDPDDAWDPAKTLEFGDAARVYLGEIPITNWEIEGAFALVAQFVHDWALGEARGYDVSSDMPEPVTDSHSTVPLPIVSPRAVDEGEDVDYLERMTLETKDPHSGSTLRIMFGEFNGTPTLALFVDGEDPPILIDRSALELAMGQWSLAVGPNEPAFVFSGNADRDLEVAYPEMDSGPEFA